MMRFLFPLVLLLLVFASPVRAEFSVGVVDVHYLQTQSKAALDIQRQLDKRRKVIVEEFSEAKQKLIEQEKVLVKLRADLSNDEFAAKVQDFEKEKLKLQKMSVEYRKEIEAASIEAEKELMDHIVTVTSEIAAENQYDLVLIKRTVVVGAMSLDITKEALKRLNKKFPKIDVKLKD